MVKKILAFLILTLALFNINAIPSFASYDKGLPYLVEPIFPENQDKHVNQYISISPKSNSLNQEIKFLVTNKTNKKQKINIKIFNAYTSPNGIIQYAAEETKDSIIIDKKYEIKRYIQAPKAIELDGGQSKIVKLKINMKGIEGTILGGVAFQSADVNTQTQNKKGITFEIKNEINSVIGIAINFPTSQDYEFKFGDAFLDPMPTYYAISLPVTLDRPLLLKDVDLKYEVYFEGKKLFFSKEKLDFAPMTKTNFSLPYDYDVIKNNGVYELKGSLTYKDKKGEQKTVNFEKDFKVNNIAENSFMPTKKMLDVPKVEGENSWLFSAMWFIPLLLLLWFIYKMKNKQYVLYSDNPIEPEIVVETDELFNQIHLQRRNDNVENFKYKHIYKRFKNEKQQLAYKKLKTIVLQNQ